MAGVVDRLAARLQPREAGAEGGEVAVGRRDQRRRPAHDLVAGEERVCPRPRRSSGGRRYARASPARSASSRDRRPPRPRRCAGRGGSPRRSPRRRRARRPPRAAPSPATARRPGRRAPGPARRPGSAKAARAGAVVAVGVGDEHRRDPLARHRGGERGEVARVVGAGVDDRDLALADDVAAGAGEGHRARRSARSRRAAPARAARRRRSAARGRDRRGSAAMPASPLPCAGARRRA